MPMSAGAHGDQKRVSGPLELSDRWVRSSRCGCWEALSPLQDFLFFLVLFCGEGVVLVLFVC